MATTGMQSAPEKTFSRNGIHLDPYTKKEVYTSGDQITGVVHYDPLWGTKSVTDVKINLYGDADPDWFTDGDDGESRTGILELNLSLYRGAAVERKNFPFDFQFPSHTAPTTPHHLWNANDHFEHIHGHPLPRTWDCHCSRVRYTLNAYVTTSTGKVVQFSKRLKYRPSLDTRVEDIPWREHVYLLSGFFHSARLLLHDAIESCPTGSKLLKFRFPTILVADAPLRGSVQVHLPHPVESLKIWYLTIEARFTTGYRTLGRQNEITTRQCYGRVQLLSLHAITLPQDHLLDLHALSTKPIPPFYTFRTFNIYVSGHLYIRALFSDPAGKMYRLSIPSLPIQVVGSPNLGRKKVVH